MPNKANPHKKAEAALRDWAFRFPEVHEDFPWGERALKVKGKVFVFMRAGETGLSICTKLKDSHADALALPFTEPSAYGLGKHGWVVAKFEPEDTVPVELLCGWIEESYRAVAPKKLVEQITEIPQKPARKRAKAGARKLSAR